MRKDTPTLPGSSRMKMPAMGDNVGNKIGKIASGKATAAVSAAGVATKSAGGRKSKPGMKGSNPYC